MTTQKMLNNVSGQDNHAQRVCQLVKTIVANYYELPMDSYKSKSRVGQVIKLKRATVWFIRKLLPKATSVYIGKQMGYDHATVLYCLRKVEEFIETKDVETTEDIRKIGDIIELKNQAITLGKDADKGFYHISMDKCTSVKLPNGQGIVFSGMLPNQVAELKGLLERHYQVPLNTRKHANTGLFILERLPNTEDVAPVTKGKEVVPTNQVKSNKNDESKKEETATSEVTEVSLPKVQENSNTGEQQAMDKE